MRICKQTYRKRLSFEEMEKPCYSSNGEMLFLRSLFSSTGVFMPLKPMGNYKPDIT